MRTERGLRAALLATVLSAASAGSTWPDALIAQQAPAPAAASPASSAPVTVADLVAPVALYPDQLLGQVLTVSTTPQEVLDLGNWLIENDTLTGSKAQDAAKEAGFSTSAQYLALFPQVVDNMCQQIDWTTQLGDAYTDDPKAVMAAIQAKRSEAVKAGNLKTSSQLTVNTKKADNGTSYIEIVPTDPKVIYVPVYNPVTVYVQAPAAPAPVVVTNTTVVVQQQSGVSSGTAVGIGLLSFGVGMAVGAAIHTNYYPYPMWGYGGMYYGGRPYYPPPYRPPYYPGYHPAYGYHPPANYHWNQVNRQTNITINNNNYYNKINNNSNNRNRSTKNVSRPGQVGGGDRAGAGGGNRPSEYKGARPSGGGNDRPGGGMANANTRPGAGGAGGAGAKRPAASGAGPDRPGAGGAGRPAAGAGDRGYGGGAGGGGANRASPQPATRPSPQGGGGFGSAGGGSGSSARAASSRGRASTGAPPRNGGAGAAHGGGGGGRRR